MEQYRLELCGMSRDLDLIPINDTTAYASFVIIGDVELIKACAPALAEKIRGADIIVTAEAKGIALAYEISRLLGLKEFVVARKSVKSYMQEPVEVSVWSITTAGEQHLYLDRGDAGKIEDRNVCILDDVISTGESIKGLEQLVQEAGGRVITRACVLAEGRAAERKDIIYLQKLPLFRIGPLGEYEAINEQEESS